MYLPGMMACAWVAAGIVGLEAAPRFRSAVAVGMLGLASLWTYQRNVVWSDPVRLWSDTATKSPGKARVHANLGVALAADGRREEAKASLERAVELDPTRVTARVALANLAIDAGGDLERAERLLEGVVRDEPAHAPALVGLGVIELRRGALESSAQWFREALSHEETHREALYNLGVAYFRQGDFGGAATVLERGANAWPADATMLALLGAAWLEAGDPARAASALRRSLELAPEGALAARYLARIEEDVSPGAVSK